MEADMAESGAPLGALVIDDDPMLLHLLRAVLGHEGFTIWTADSGAAGLALYGRHRGQIDVVLIDVRMPGQDGPQTLAELRQLDAAVPCCFMSGFSGEYSEEDLARLGATAFFSKPFQINELAGRLRQIAQKPARRSA
jgi:DNA-binding response OmpR family regulator